MRARQGKKVKERAGNAREHRHTPPEARDANYSGSCEQFVEYSGNVCLIPAGHPRQPAGIYICGEYRDYITRYIRRELSRDYSVCLLRASGDPSRWRKIANIRASKG